MRTLTLLQEAILPLLASICAMAAPDHLVIEGQGLPPTAWHPGEQRSQTAALKGKSICVGGGWQEGWQHVIHAKGFNTTHTGPAREVSTFAKADIPVAFLPQPCAAW